MIEINVGAAIESLRKDFNQVTGAEFSRAVASAINHTAAKAKTGASQEIRQIYGLKQDRIAKAINISKANGQSLTAKVIAKGRPLSLTYFNGTRQIKKGASVAVIKGQRKVIKGAFIKTMRSGHEAVFVRGKYDGSGGVNYGKKRLPIQELKSTAIPKALSNGIVLRNLSQKINADFPQRAQHELTRLINRRR